MISVNGPRQLGDYMAVKEGRASKWANAAHSRRWLDMAIELSRQISTAEAPGLYANAIRRLVNYLLHLEAATPDKQRYLVRFYGWSIQEAKEAAAALLEKHEAALKRDVDAKSEILTAMRSEAAYLGMKMNKSHKMAQQRFRTGGGPTR